MRFSSIAFVLLLTGSVAAEPVSFTKDVWPILANRCIQCHGEAKIEGELRLDSPDGFAAGGEYGAVVEAGKPESSTLIELIMLPPDDSDVMPGKGDTLSQTEITTLTQWVTDGASFDGWTPSLAAEANAAVKTQLAARAAEATAGIPATFNAPAERIEFNRDIRPILSDNCFKCHGPDRAALKADLRLDLEEWAKRITDEAAAIRPGDPRASELVRRIFHPNPEETMPPEKSGKELTDAEKHLLAAWIEQGAEYELHWAYNPPQKRRPPRNRGDEWSRNDIDRFVLARLGQENLSPSPEADPITLVRRLSYDLTGLPPDPGVADAFAANPSDKAYRKLVDDLLASPHYGERMAVHWLDQVRYADSNGYHSDEERVMYPYRDYVIESFNDNKPYDEFTVEQLAGDLLKEPTREQLVATGFNRLNQITAEGGAQSKEYRAKYNADRVRALGTVWMGATLGCVECHEHKFDPYEHGDFYRFAAFFADIEEDDVYPGRSRWAPNLLLPNEFQQEEWDRIDELIEDLEKQLLEPSRARKKANAAWLDVLENQGEVATEGWLPLEPIKASTENGGEFETMGDLSILSVGLDAPQDLHEFTFVTDQSNISALRFDAFDHPSFEFQLSRHRGHTKLNEVEIEVRAPGASEAAPVTIKEGFFNFSEKHNELRSTFDGNESSGWFRGGSDENARKPIAWMYVLDQPIPGGPGTEITVRLQYLGIAGQDRSAFGRLRVSATTDEEPDIAAPVGAPERLVVTILEDGRVTRDERAMATQFFQYNDAELTDLREELTRAYASRRALWRKMDYTLVTKQIPVPREVRLLPRGNWQDDSGEVLTPGVPKFLPPLSSDDEHADRLDLAEWLIDEDNPLTARVFVNRLWKLYFGKGISGVLDDLGSQGEPPVHPELLDWLALEFVGNDWDVKDTVRTILLSSTYRQRSDVTAQLAERDPGNRLLARQSAIRYDAEMIRDTALAVGGLLNDSIGGASVRPYQPEGYWEHLNFPKRTYEHDANEDQYRRGLYVHWQRSFLHPSMKAFDAPSREECVAERPLSNTPMQALVLLNDPTYVEASRAFAERIMNEGGADASAKIAWAMRQAVSRTPTAEELNILTGLYEKHRAEYEGHDEQVEALSKIGMKKVPDSIDKAELGAWTSVARVILNLHETITRS